jgi:glucokinase
VGVAPAGFVDALRGSVVFAPHLAWRSAPLRDELAARLGLPVFVDNDANAAVWAEWRFGAARGVAHVACVTLGTGIGGALLVDGVLYRGAHGMAGEFGHMVVVPNGLACACGNRGCWERYVSGTALVEAAREQAAGSPRGRRLPTGAGDDPAAPTGPQLAAAAAAGDPAAVALFTQMGGWLGVGLANLAAALDPAMFVVGGGLGEAGEVLLAPAREAFRAALPGRGHRPEVRIVAAVLGNDAGLVGIADLARTVAG